MNMMPRQWTITTEGSLVRASSSSSMRHFAKKVWVANRVSLCTVALRGDESF